MHRWFLAALAAAFLLVATACSSSTSAIPADTVASSTPVRQAECVVPQDAHNEYVQAVYRRSAISLRARREMRRMRGCASSAKAAENERRVERLAYKTRRERANMECGSIACNRRLGMAMAAKLYGPGAGKCIDFVVMHESSWSHDVNNGGSHGPPIPGHAYGIPQALPAAKMASAGRDWQTNPKTQIKWMLGYVKRYRGPCGAAAFRASHGSY